MFRSGARSSARAFPWRLVSSLGLWVPQRVVPHCPQQGPLAFLEEDRQELPARLYWAPAAAGGGENRVSRVLPKVGGELVPFTG